MNGKSSLTILIILGLVFGAIVGQFLYDPTWSVGQEQVKHAHATWLAVFEFLGFNVFMNLLKVLIIPLIATSVVVAITSIKNFQELGRLGSWTLVYYFSTMLLAVVLGLFVVNIIEPGVAIDELQRTQTAESGSLPENVTSKSNLGVFGVFRNLFSLMITDNIFRAMGEGQTLPIIVFFIFFGVVLTLVGEQAKEVVKIFESLFEVLMRMIEIVLWLAPLGVFALLAWTVARIGLGVFGESIGLYMICVLLGLSIHGFVVLPLILWLTTRINPYRFIFQMRQAIFTAIGTDSSSATLPVTIDCATTQAGVSKRAAGLVLPLGATINMDGTALYEAVAVVFMAQAFAIDLNLSQMIIIAITATLAAVGAAGIPSAGLVTMVIVLEATNQSLLQTNPTTALIPISAIGLIIGVDRILDMFRTAVNVLGDAVGAKIISAKEHKLIL